MEAGVKTEDDTSTKRLVRGKTTSHKAARVKNAKIKTVPSFIGSKSR